MGEEESLDGPFFRVLNHCNDHRDDFVSIAVEAADEVAFGVCTFDGELEPDLGLSGLRFAVTQCSRRSASACADSGDFAPSRIQARSSPICSADRGSPSGDMRSPASFAETLSTNRLSSGCPAVTAAPLSPPRRIASPISTRRPASCFSAP
jgi:hypothetical protein